jgi:hypothetical protein
MKISNQELYKLNMPQVIIEDTTTSSKWASDVEGMNKETLDSMYRIQSAVYNLFANCDMRELAANTISPAQQNIFIPLKTWIVNLGGCFAKISIHQRCFSGCYAEMKII